MESLEGKRVLVTGGSKGIGAAVARQATAEGARVLITGRDPGRLERTSSTIGCAGVRADVGREEDVLRTYAAADEQLGGVDILVNNAGIPELAAIEEIDAAGFERVWRVNVLGAALMAREAAKRFKPQRSGSIVNVSSTAGLKGYPRGTPYVATKFALNGMSQCWQAELRPYGIRVIVVHPSEIQTGFGRPDEPDAVSPRKLLAEDVADVILSTLKLDQRGFIPAVTLFATNPWDPQ